MTMTLPAEAGLVDYEGLSRDLIVVRQRERMVTTLRRVAREVPHYTASFEAVGLTPSDVVNPEVLERLPFVTKSTLRDHGSDLYVVDDPVDFVSSSGTAGRPIILPIRREEEPLRVSPIRRALRELGVRRGDRVLHNINMFAL
jgi:phenylacetate-CoA ligase